MDKRVYIHMASEEQERATIADFDRIYEALSPKARAKVDGWIENAKKCKYMGESAKYLIMQMHYFLNMTSDQRGAARMIGLQIRNIQEDEELE